MALNCNSEAKFYLLVALFPFLLHSGFVSKFSFSSHSRLKIPPHVPLHFTSQGTFKILQVADMHFGNGLLTRCRDVSPDEFYFCSDLNTTRFLERMIELEKPDFIAFTGDNIFGSSSTDAAKSILRALKPVFKSRTPWAAVLGNHDQESTLTRKQLMQLLSNLDYSLSQINPNFAPIDGFGNYNIQVNGPPGSESSNTSVLNLYFLDSGDRELVNGVKTYGYIKESQLQWLRKESNEANGYKKGAKKAPALGFFHIPIPEVRGLYWKEIVGQFQEAVACSFVDSGVLNALVSVGDIKAVLMGHDHTNDFCGNLEGIWFCYGGGFGYHGYGKVGWHRRARVVVAELQKGNLFWEGVKRITTWKRLDDGILTKVDEQILWSL